MLRNIFSKLLFERRQAMIWWALGIVALVMLIVAFYPTIRDNNEMTKLLDGMPKEMLAMAGITDIQSLTTPAGYLQARLFSMLLPLLLLVFAIGIGTRSIAGEEESRTIDMLLSHPVRRSQVVLQSFAALLALVTSLGLVIILTLVIGAQFFGMQDVGVDRLVAGTASSLLLALFFGTLALFIGATTGKRGLTTGITSAFAVVAYLINSLAEAVEWLKPAQQLSPFYYATASNPLLHGLDWGHSSVLAVLIGLLVVGSVFTFERRDIAV